ncbi:Arylsulfatase A [Devosia enhydra]|uniref:Arylsulfatase A n=1 Tax=Devosia enhydra TaxID=665118 RepID=A0A1K2HVZ4_9HYPH|nr:sulfatase [Devosia enhydra]SFZ83069.1 Arylsulfatase A [Devosia enhydra]
MKTVFVLFDSLNRKAISPYGGNPANTPNFQRFSERAITFDTHYVGSMPCMPARRDLQTGRLGMLHRNWGPLEPFDNSLPEILKSNGVYSHLVTDHNHYFMDGGATYHPRFSSWELVRGNGSDHWKGVVKPDTARFRQTFHPSQIRPYLNTYYVNRDYMADEADHPTTQVFRHSLDFIETNKHDDNWFLQIEAFDPHEPFFVPERFKARHKTNYSGPIIDWPTYGRGNWSDEEKAEIESNYAALVSMCDEYFGRLLDLFNRYDLWKDTALIVSTDHGFLLGEHDWWGKNVMPIYDELARIPLLVYHPDFADQGGARRASLTQAVDLMPTILGFHGLPVPDEVTGRSLLPVLAGDAPVREAALYGYFGAACNVTDGRYTYLRYPEPMTADNLYEYTLMPTRMHKRFGVQELSAAELVPPFGFSKGMPLLRTKPLATPDNIPAIMEGRIFEDCVTRLFDSAADPGQTQPIDDPVICARMERHLFDLFCELEAPPEAFVRFGLDGVAA